MTLRTGQQPMRSNLEAFCYGFAVPFVGPERAADFAAEVRGRAERELGFGPTLGVPEAAKRLGIAPANVRQAIGRHSIAATRAGRDWVITVAEVDRYARENARPRRAPAP